KEVRAGSKAAKAEVSVIDKLLPHLDTGKPAITLALTDEEKAVARDFFLLSSKPTLFACNVAESDLAAISAGLVADGGTTAQDHPGPGNHGDNSAISHVAAVQEYARNHFATEAVV